MRSATVAGLIACTAVAVAAQTPQTHSIRAGPSTITWGYFDPAAKPVLTIASGDRVHLETVLAPAEFLQRLGVDDRLITPAMRALDQVKDRGAGGHWLVGPIYIRNADVGDVLEVRIEEIRVTEAFAVNGFAPGGGTLPFDFPFQRSRTVPLDLQAGVANFGPGIAIPIRPFFGNMGVAPPPLVGRISSNAPGVHAGNLDNKDLVAGSTLYIPVQVPGALFSVGDGHAGQGNGEVDGSALETSLAGTFQIIVRKDLHWKWPRAETPTHLMTIGLDADLNEAARLATRDMVAFIVERYRVSDTDAYILASVAADLHVTQLVDGVKGIHAMLPKAIFDGRR